MSQPRSEGLVSMNQILSLYLPSVLLSLGTSLVAPVIPGLAKSFDVGVSMASLVFVAANAGQLAATFPTGYLIDKIGRRPVLLAGPMLTGVASFMTPFSHTIWELFFWRFLTGVALQIWQQARLAVIADTAKQRERARQVQWMMGVGQAGTLFGPSVGGFLAAGFGLAVPFVAHAVLTVLAIIPSFWLVRESDPARQKRSEGDAAAPSAPAENEWGRVIAYMLTFQMLVFLSVQMLANLSRGGFDQGALNLYAVYNYGLGPDTLGLLNTAAIFFGLPVPFLSGYLMDRFGRRSVIVPGFSAYATALILMSVTAFMQVPLEFFMVGYVLVQATQGTTGGTMQVLGTDLSPPFARGRFFAIWRTIAQLGATVTPAVFATIAEHAGFGYSFVYLGTCSLLVAIGVGVLLGDTLARQDAAERGKPA
ncbi:MAG: MFS transporter [Chloroflexota bacterium]